MIRLNKEMGDLGVNEFESGRKQEQKAQEAKDWNAG